MLRFCLFKASKENTEALAELASTKEGLQKIYDAIIALSPKRAIPAIMEDKPLIPPEVPRSTPKVTPQQLHKRYGLLLNVNITYIFILHIFKYLYYREKHKLKEIE